MIELFGFLNYGKNSICCKQNDKLSIVHGLWPGAVEYGDEFFTLTFWECVESDQIEMMEYIGEKPSGIDKFDQIKWSCLHTIAYCIHPELITHDVRTWHLSTLKTLFLLHFKDLMHFSTGGNLPVHLACQMNNSYILKIIIEVANEKLSKQQFNEMLNQVKKDKYWNCTPLMIAIKTNSIDCVKILCQYNCVIDGIFKYKSRYPNYNSLEFACYYNNVDILKIFCNICDLKQCNLNSKEYLSYLKNLAKHGASRGYLLRRNCAEFLDDLSSNSISKPKQVISVSGDVAITRTFSNSGKHQLKFVCCRNHEFPREMLFAPEKCDICQENSAKCVACPTCALYKHSNLFPSIICQKCVIATSVWLAVRRSAQNSTKTDYLEQLLSNFINANTLKRVEFSLTYTTEGS